ncbi:hypothetical protein GHT06_007629 [Daphnia sinensis]|uniref:Uncharacterized protein n=1 Tax=Daphnia sinensis TaxID=1820382 RepID=A0AAD5L313_9CRUS|nr:hypothetical protein GHT06_005217 [Daphnia sinensis]KAI9550038.1 hypothetical protein GHT06_007629 [Daphnia sinensis]
MGVLKKSPEELVVEDLSREMYSIGNHTSKENLPLGAKVQLQAFLHTASFKKTQISYQEKWLSRISVDSALDAFGFGLAKLNRKVDQLSNKELIFVLHAILETSVDYPGRSQHTEQIVNKILLLDDVSSILTKILMMPESGRIELTTATLERIFAYHSKVLDTYCEGLNTQLEKGLVESWMVKACSESPQLYETICRKLKQKNPANLPKFVENICAHVHVLPYPSHEQSCATLCMITTKVVFSPLMELHYSKLIDELLRLWCTHPESIFKMISHFPCIIQCLSESCNNNVNAKRLCIHLISSGLIR